MMAGKIGRRHIPNHVYRALLARSGNKCAYPGCVRPIVNTHNIYEAQLCHIESVGHKEQRFNPNLTDEEVNGYNNLMFMCLKHHIETNDENVYTVDVLRNMKYTHEAKYVEAPYHVDMSHIYALKRDSEEYWSKIENWSNIKQDLPDLNVSINTKADFNVLSVEVIDTLSLIDDLVEIIDKEDKNKYWEIFNIGFPNHLNKIIQVARNRKCLFLLW
jgi:hypothetical protein